MNALARRTLCSIVVPTMAGAAACRETPAIPPSQTTIAAPWLWGHLERGSYALGLHVIAGADSSRPEPLADGRSGPRPLEIVVWTPGPHENLTRDTVRFARYVDLSDGAVAATDSGRIRDARRRWLAESMSRAPASVPEATLDSILAAPMAAVVGLPPATARAPAVLWSTRHATPAAQSVLSEYLASHGYVVAWVRYTGIDSLRPPFDDVSPARKSATLEAHVADMQWALRRLRSHPAIDTTRLGVAAWSYSGEPATVLAQRTPSLRVLVSLSSNIFVSTYRGVDIAASLDSMPLRAGVLMLEETGAARGQPRVPSPILDRLPGKAYRVSFATLAHGNFNVLEGLLPALTGVTAVQPWSIGGAGAQTGYETIARAVLALLDKTMQGAAGGGGFRPPDGVAIERHGPGRGVSAVEGMAYVDTRVMITSDGWQLASDFVQPRETSPRVPTVLMLNKANGDRRVYATLARELARRGIASLRLDLRGEGESTNLGSFVPGVPNAAIEHAERDVAAAFEWLRGQGVVDSTRMGVVGASYSGELMAMAARGVARARARAYVALSPGSLSIETIDGIDPTGTPWWILRSRNERFVRDVVDSTRARSRSARVSEVGGNAHASDMLVSHPELAVQVADWLVTALRR